jgi:hypothetical protein
VRATELQELLTREVRVPTRDEPDIALEEADADGVVVRIQATPVSDADGARLADEVLAVITKLAAEAPARTS